MLNGYLSFSVLIASLIIIAGYALRDGKKKLVPYTNSIELVSSKNRHSGFAIGWSFFASGMGSWVLFSFPEVGIVAGCWGVIGYAISCCIPLGILALVGPWIREEIGDGITWSDYIYKRYGRSMQIYVICISLMYQFIALVGELTGIGFVMELISPSISKLYSILLVSLVTTIYTSVGGLRSSILTDTWQGIGVFFLLLILCISLCFFVEIPSNALKESHIASFTLMGFESLITLCIAVTSANLFLTGFWQRVWAAETDHQLRLGCLYASFFSIPFAVLLSITGMISHVMYPDDMPFFSILSHAGWMCEVLVVIIISFAVASSVDTIQNGICAELITSFPSYFNLVHTRVFIYLLNIPAVLLAMEGISVLKLFLLIDLWTATAVGPMLLSFYSQTHWIGAVGGSFIGLISIFFQGLYLFKGDIFKALNHFLLPDGIYATSTMIAFILAFFLSTSFCILISFILSFYSPSSPKLKPYLTP